MEMLSAILAPERISLKFVVENGDVSSRKRICYLTHIFALLARERKCDLKGA